MQPTQAPFKHIGKYVEACSIGSIAYDVTTNTSLSPRWTVVGCLIEGIVICKNHDYWKSYLAKHSQTHNDVTLFDCGTCNQSFSTRSSFNQHMKTDTNLKPFLCTLCGKAFTWQSSLKRHLKTHESIL